MAISLVKNKDTGLVVRSIINDLVNYANNNPGVQVSGSSFITGSLTVNTINVGQNTINFIDDNTNHSRRFLQHFHTQQEMYDAMRAKKMVCKVSKSHFLYPSAKILGHIMSEYGRTPDPEKIKPIMEMAPPRNISELRSLLGLINVNKDYLPLCKNYLGPLEELLKKDADVANDWRPEYHGKAFEETKLALTSAPCLLTLDIAKPFVLHVDACRVGRGLGAVLLQQNHKEDRVRKAFYS